MNGNESKLYEALTKIAETANEAIGECECTEKHGHEEAGEKMGELPSCTIKRLPNRLQVKAAKIASNIDPLNTPFNDRFHSPALRALNLAPAGTDLQVMEPQRISILTSKYWGKEPRKLTVSFMETTPADLRKRIISHMNAWTKTGGISFVWTSGIGQVRVSRGGGGYYSYLGTDILLIPKNRQTMNLQGFTMNTPESEYRRVVRHETGHTLGCPHEHMRKALVERIDPQKAYDYFWRTQGWDQAMVNAQVLTPLNEASLMSTPPDQTSIMCYQLPSSITRDGDPILGGKDINATDFAFIGERYPKVGAVLAGGEDRVAEASDEWDESEDVDVDI